MSLIIDSPNSPEGKDILGQLRKLCPEAHLKVNREGLVTAQGDFCKFFLEQHFRRTKHVSTCACICQLLESQNVWTIKGEKMSFEDVKEKRTWPHTRAANRENGVARPNGRPGEGTGGTITAPTMDSTVAFDAYDPKGKSHIAPPHIVLGHELCGHAAPYDAGTHDPRPQLKGDRPGHDQAIDRENAVRKDQGMSTMRGKYNSPNRGESTAHEKK